jgi:hypothetical protein
MWYNILYDKILYITRRVLTLCSKGCDIYLVLSQQLMITIPAYIYIDPEASDSRRRIDKKIN